MARAGIRMVVKVFDQAVSSDLKRVRRIVPAAASAALNRANTRARAVLIRGAQRELGLANQKTLRRQIRIPRNLRATPRRLRAAGVYGVLVPAALGFSGDRRYFADSGKPVPYGSGESDPFFATMASGHRGIFVRMPPGTRGHKIEARPLAVNSWGRTELPIREVFSNETPRLFRVAVKAIQEGNIKFQERFDHELRRRLSKIVG